MGKLKISRTLKKSVLNTNKTVKCSAWSPTKEILDPNNLALAVAECLVNNDPEGVLEVIEIYLETANMVKISKKAHISRATLYHSLRNKNPTIKTLAKLIHGIAA